MDEKIGKNQTSWMVRNIFFIELPYIRKDIFFYLFFDYAIKSREKRM